MHFRKKNVYIDIDNDDLLFQLYVILWKII